MNNSKTYILAAIGAAVLFSSSFAIGAHSNRVQTPSDNTSNFAYPKVDEIAPVEPQTDTSEPKQKERKTRSNSTTVTSIVTPKHHRIITSRKVRAKITQPAVAIPVPPPNEIPFDGDADDRQNPTTIIEKAVAQRSDKASQPAEKQQSKEKEEPNNTVREKTKQIEQEDETLRQTSPEKSGKEVTPKHPPVEAPTEVKPEPSTPAESSK